MNIQFEELPLMLGSYPVGQFDGHVVVSLGDEPTDYPEVIDVVVYSRSYDHSARKWVETHVSLRSRAVSEPRTGLDRMLWIAAADDTKRRMIDAHAQRWATENAALDAAWAAERPDRLLMSEDL